MAKDPADSQKSGLVELRALLHRFGVFPKRTRGQNFLHDRNLLGWIGGHAELGPTSRVLEVGGGSGFLTRELVARASRVLVVELDDKLAECLRSQFGEDSRVTILETDVLAGKRGLHPSVLDGLRELTADGEPVQCVSNLPYAVAVSFLVGLLAAGVPLGPSMVMVQREVADRIVAEPGSRDYGVASVLLQLQAEVRIVRSVPPQVFWPRPKIDSAILSLRPYNGWSCDVGREGLLSQVVRAGFQHRRKRLVNALGHARDLAPRDTPFADLMSEAGIADSVRAEDLSPADYARLAVVLSSQIP